jgi:predicted metal-dependent peptidase
MNKESSIPLRIQKARTALLLDHPFFGSLLFRLKGQERPSIQTMATDGVSLFYNPEFVATLSQGELAGVLAHEVMHPALQHHTRRADRSLKHWNIACDYAINPLLVDAGLTLPKDVLLDNRFRGMSAEGIYNLLDQNDRESQQKFRTPSNSGNPSKSGDDGESSQDGSEDGPNAPKTPGGIGQVLDAPSSEEADGKDSSEQARDWQIAVEQAESLAKLAGKVPAGLERSVKKAAQAA